mgnify:CR=1 FL=1
MGEGTTKAYQYIRKSVPFLEEDRTLYPLMEKVLEMVENSEILEAVESVIGELK